MSLQPFPGELDPERIQQIEENTRKGTLELRSLELNAYNGLMSALRAAGGIDEEKRQVMRVVRKAFSIPDERHRAELRRVACDEKLTMIADAVSGGHKTSEKWLDEGREKFSEANVRRKYNSIIASSEKFFRDFRDQEFYPLTLNDLFVKKRVARNPKNLSNGMSSRRAVETLPKVKVKQEERILEEGEILIEENLNDSELTPYLAKEENFGAEINKIACRKKFAKKWLAKKYGKKAAGKALGSASEESSGSSSETNFEENEGANNKKKGPKKPMVKVKEEKSTPGPGRKRLSVPQLNNNDKRYKKGGHPGLSKMRSGKSETSEPPRTLMNHIDRRRKAYRNSLGINKKFKAPIKRENLDPGTSMQRMKGGSRSKIYKRKKGLKIIQGSSPRKLASPDITDPVRDQLQHHPQNSPYFSPSKKHIIIDHSRGPDRRKKRFQGRIKPKREPVQRTSPEKSRSTAQLEDDDRDEDEEGEVAPICSDNEELQRNRELDPSCERVIVTPLEADPPQVKKNRRKSVLTGRKMRPTLEEEEEDENGNPRKNRRKNKAPKTSLGFDYARLKRKGRKNTVFMDFDRMEEEAYLQANPGAVPSNLYSSSRDRKSPRKVSPQIYKPDFGFSSSTAGSSITEQPPQPTPVANYFGGTGLTGLTVPPGGYLRNSSNSGTANLVNSPTAEYFSNSILGRRIGGSSGGSVGPGPQYKFYTEGIAPPKSFSTIHLPNTSIGLSGLGGPSNSQIPRVGPSYISQAVSSNSTLVGGGVSQANPSAASSNAPQIPPNPTPSSVQRKSQPHILSTAKLANRQILLTQQQTGNVTGSPGVVGGGASTASPFGHQSIPIQLRSMAPGQHHNIIFLQKTPGPGESKVEMGSGGGGGGGGVAISTASSNQQQTSGPGSGSRAVILRRALPRTTQGQHQVMMFANNGVTTTSLSSSPSPSTSYPPPIGTTTSMPRLTSISSAGNGSNTQTTPSSSGGAYQQQGHILKKTLSKSQLELEDSSIMMTPYSSQGQSQSEKDFLAESLLKSNILEMDDLNQPGKNIQFQIIHSSNRAKSSSEGEPSNKSYTSTPSSEPIISYYAGPSEHSPPPEYDGEEVVQSQEIEIPY